MKTGMIPLLVLLVLSSVQARVIPADSVESYIDESMQVATELRQELDPTDSEDLMIAINLYPKLQETSPEMVHAKYYFALLVHCGMDESICLGLAQVCSDLSRKIKGIEPYLTDIKNPGFAKQLKEILVYLTDFSEDIIDSIPSEECRKYVRDGQWVTD